MSGSYKDAIRTDLSQGDIVTTLDRMKNPEGVVLEVRDPVWAIIVRMDSTGMIGTYTRGELRTTGRRRENFGTWLTQKELTARFKEQRETKRKEAK